MEMTDTSAGTSGKDICKRVLVVDSTPSTLAATVFMLLTEYYSVTSTISGIEALAILEERPAGFDFVLTDIHLDDINGFEFLESLQKMSNIVVFVLSADISSEVVRESFNKGIVMFYEKPIARGYIDELWRNTLIENRRRQSIVTVKGKSPFYCEREQFKGIWTNSLHALFIQAVKEIGLKYANGENILQFMNVDGLTKKDVTIHLQIYFLSLMKMEQEALNQQAQDIEIVSLPRRG